MKWFLVLASFLFLSACLKQDPKPDMYTTTPSLVSPTASVTQTVNISPTPQPTLSDEDLLDQLEKESDLNLDAQFKQLEIELQ